MSKMIKVIGASALTTVFGSQIAVAQDDMFAREKVDGAGERYLPEYDQREVNLGGFVLKSELGLGVESNSNIFAQKQGEDADTIVSITPAANLSSNWSNHEISADFKVDHQEYTDFGDESHTDLIGALRGRLDVSRELNLSVNVGAEELTEDRGAIAFDEDLNSLPAEYSVVYGGGEVDWKSEAVRFTVGANTRELSYDDIEFTDDIVRGDGENDRSYRDHTQVDFKALAAYAVSPDVAVFVETNVSERDYDSVPVDGATRDASGYRVQVGTNFQSQLFRGEAAIGYLREEREDITFDDVEGLAASVDLQWLLSPLTTVSVGLDRYVADTGDVLLPSALISHGELGVVHELKRNFLLNASFVVGVEELDGSAIVEGYNQDYYDVGAGALYKLNRNAHVDFNLRFSNRESNLDGRGRNFDRTVVGVGLKLYP